MPVYKPFATISPSVLAGLALLLLPPDSTALEWSFQPSVSAGSTVNDNPDLSTAPHESEWSSTFSPQVALSARSAQSSLVGGAKINRYDYLDTPRPSATNGQLDLTFTRQFERSELSLAGNLVRNSTLESELIQTGIVTSRAQRTSRTLLPSWSYSITERDSLMLGYSYLDVGYSDTTSASRLLDYTEQDPSLTYTHAFTEKNKLNLTLGYSDYQSQNPVSLTTKQYRYTTTSAQVGVSRNFSETLSVSVMAGAHKTDSTISGLDCHPIFLPECFPVPIELNTSETGSLFKASLQQAFESSQLNAEFSRSLQPTGDGGLVQTDRLSGGYSAKYSATLSGSLNMSIYQTQYSEVSRTSNDSRYYSITPALSWQLTELWTASTYYSRSVSQKVNGIEAAGNAINLTLGYNWPKVSRSR